MPLSQRQNIADALRHSSLAESSRMGELLNRFERGMPCGTPDDIDFLIDEIVIRIEQRLLCRLARLSEMDLDHVSEGPGEQRDSRAAKLSTRPRRIISDSTLRHEARLLVDQVLGIVIRHFQPVAQKKQKKMKTDERKSSEPTSPSTSRGGGTKISPQIVTERDNYAMASKQAEPRFFKEVQPTGFESVKESQKRLPPGDSGRTATTNALRKEAESSLRRYSVTGNISALLHAGERAKEGDSMQAEQVSKAVTTPIHQDVKILLASSRDSDDRGRGVITPADTPAVLLSTLRKEPPKTRGVNQLLNSSYTYARRSEIKKALPKYVVSRSKEAMMTVFDAIRVAMAEEEVENLDYAGLLATLTGRSLHGKEFPQRAIISKPKAILRQQPGIEPSFEKKTESEPRYGRLPGSSGKHVPSKPDGTRDRLSARQQNFGTLGTYTLRKATCTCLRHIVQKGSSYNALLMMASNIKNGQTDEEFWNEALDMDLDEVTRKEVISDLAEMSRQARAGTRTPPETLSDEPRKTFADNLEGKSLEWKAVTFEEEPPHSETPAVQSHLDRDDNVYSRSNMDRQSTTNYICGMHRGLRRLMPKFTGGRPYAALMHHADSMIADEYQEMICTGQLVPLTVSFNATEPRKVSKKVTSVEPETRIIKPVCTVGGRRSVSTQTSKTDTKNPGDELFHHAYSWIAQESSDKYETKSGKQREQESVLPTASDEDILYRPMEDIEGGEEDFTSDAYQQETKERDGEPLHDGTEKGFWRSIEEKDDDATKRSVRFADGLHPGKTDNYGQDQSSVFFQKLGYYERVGSGEHLHPKPKKPKKKSHSRDGEPSGISQAGLEQEGDDGEPQQTEQPATDQAEQEITEERKTKSNYSLCNCI